MANLAVELSGGEPWDRPPFCWLGTAMGVLSLLVTSVIVITQARQGRIAERNAHLSLQVGLLADQKAAKIIGLIEEMRLDSPNLRNRRDEEAEALQVALDPGRVAAAIVERMEAADAELHASRSDDASGTEPGKED